MNTIDSVYTEENEIPTNLDEKLNAIIKKFGLQYLVDDFKEMINELGIKEDDINIENIRAKASERRSELKFCLLYHNLFSFIQSPTEQIMSILIEAQAALEEVDKKELAKSIEWVMIKIKNEEIYDLDYSNPMNITPFSKKDSFNDIESKRKIFDEFSWDVFNQTKKQNLIAVRKSQNKRR